MFFLKKKNKKNPLYETLENIQNERKNVAKFIQKYNTDKFYCDFQNKPCSSNGVFIWEKDSDGRYISANDQHCIMLFHLVDGCSKSIKGKKDSELIKNITDNGIKHTFAETCKLTDDIVKEKMEQCRFIEIGYINNECRIIDVTKTPIIENGAFNGSKGIALDIPYHKEMIKGGIEDGWLEQLSKTKENTAYIYKKSDVIDFFKDK